MKQQQNTPETVAEVIKIAQILPCRYQPRKVFAAQQLQELAISIKQQGLVQPIIVRVHPELPTNYELVAGERRLRAVKLLGWTAIPALIRPYSDVQLQQVTLIENIQRQDLNAIEEAQALKSLLESLQITQEQLAQKIGKSRTAISNALRLLALPEYIQTQLAAGKVSVGQVRPLLAVSEAGEQRRLWQQVIAENLTARQVEQLVKQQKPKSAGKPTMLAAGDVHLKAIEEQLIEQLGTKVKIQGTQAQGKIEIDYYGLQNLEELLEQLLGTKRW